MAGPEVEAVREGPKEHRGLVQPGPSSGEVAEGAQQESLEDGKESYR